MDILDNRIQVLPSEIIDQISAGEVVERPASVVKELIENSLDAGANRITCRVEDGGRRLIRITDDGEGMSRADVGLSVLRHATSKIRTVSDLETIHTLGFRGEALASIAAVSKVRIVSRRRQDQAGAELRCEPGVSPALAEIGAPIGTEITVSDLFFNTPARRKFMRTAATELAHIQSWIMRLGLVRPEVHFRLEHNTRTLLDAQGTQDLAQRAAVLLGREVFEHLHSLATGDGDLQVSGLISAPSLSYANAAQIHLFVNGRFVRDRSLQHAVSEGYRTILPDGRYPLVVLRMAIAPNLVDVNVHPQKVEVRFVDGQRVHAFLSGAIAEILARSPWLKGTRVYQLRSAGSQAVEKREGAGTQSYTNRVRDALARFEHSTAWTSGASRSQSGFIEPGRLSPKGAASFAQRPQPAQTSFVASERLRDYELIGRLWDTYILLVHGDHFILVDQHAAHERITFERLRAAVDQDQIRSQRLLIPLQLELDGRFMAVAEAETTRLSDLGFETTPFGPQTIAVNAVPALLVDAPIEPLLRDVLSELWEFEKGASWESARLEILSRMACHTSVRAGQFMEEAHIRALLTSLEEVDFAGCCPHGRPVLVELNRSDIDRWFGRA
jgi:DNA mismatch repair protein MutL